MPVIITVWFAEKLLAAVMVATLAAQLAAVMVTVLPASGRLTVLPVLGVPVSE